MRLLLVRESSGAGHDNIQILLMPPICALADVSQRESDGSLVAAARTAATVAYEWNRDKSHEMTKTCVYGELRVLTSRSRPTQMGSRSGPHHTRHRSCRGTGSCCRRKWRGSVGTTRRRSSCRCIQRRRR